MKRILIGTSIALFVAANAAAGPPDPLHQEILDSARNAKKGVIVAVTEPGEVAAETAWLLSAQVTRNADYAPLLLVLKPEKREQMLKTLGLPETVLPALIFYDRKGREINRVVGALPSRLIKQARNHGNNLN
jgi:DNA-directed RNA polymerase subunit H (RpoH/RPB5)